MIWVACQSVHLVEWAWRNAQFSKEYIIWNEQREIENQQVYFKLILLFFYLFFVFLSFNNMHDNCVGLWSNKKDI